jgi:hypothetical protein
MGSPFGNNSPLSRGRRSVKAFEQFMKRCEFAQSLHRDNLGDESGACALLKSADLQKLRLTRALQREMEFAHMPTQQNAPQMPGLGGGPVRGQTKTGRQTDERS